MAKRIGMIEQLDNFYATASPDAAELITKHAIKCNKVVQAKFGNGKLVRSRSKKAGPGAVLTNGPDVPEQKAAFGKA